VALVASLHPATAYHFRLYAENALGTSAPSDPLHVSTQRWVCAVVGAVMVVVVVMMMMMNNFADCDR
jgi:hypothetical protein